LGFGILIAILAIASLIVYWQIHRVESNVTRVVEVQEPLEQTVLKMRVVAGETVQATLDYVRDRDADYIAKADDSEAEFQGLVVQFNDLAQTDEAKQLGQEAGRLYQELTGLGGEAMTLAGNQYADLRQFREDIKRIGVLIDERLQMTIDGSTPAGITKLETVLLMEEEIGRVSLGVEGYVVERDSALPQEIVDAQAAFERLEERYREAGVTPYEESWLDQISGDFNSILTDANQIIIVTDTLHETLGQFEQGFGNLSTYLDDEVQPFIHSGTIEASQRASGSTSTADKWLLALGVVGLLVGIAFAWAMSRRVSKPVAGLIEGAEMVRKGNLEHRFDIEPKDELGQLGFALNRMLDHIGRSREALGESEETAWALLDSTADSVMLIDLRGIILASNEVAAERFGKSLEQMIDVCLYDLLPPDIASTRKAQIEEIIRSRKPIHFEDEREGMVLDSRLYPVFSSKGNINRIAVFSHDITVRKWVEEVTEHLGRRNELILEAAGEGIYGLDTEGKTTFVNPAAARMLGYKPEDLIGQRHHELVHHSRPDGKSYPHGQCPIYAAFNDGAVHSAVDDEVFWRRDGTSFPVEYTSTPMVENGEIVGAVVTFRDITDRKRLEDALRRSEQKYRSIFENAASLVISVDKGGVIIDCNSRIGQVLGYTSDEVFGQNLMTLIHPDYRATAQESLDRVLIKGFEYDNHYGMLRKDGTLIDVNMNAAAVRDANGEYVRTICMIDTITGQFQAGEVPAKDSSG